MRRSPSRSLDLAALAALAIGLAALLDPGTARAQACCAAASALGIARLAQHEDAVVAVGARATSLYASMDRDGQFVSSKGASEYDFEQDIAATMRVLEHGQITAVVPIVETYRSVSGLTDAGGGLGDVQLGARYDFVETGTSRRWPGIALAWSLTLPTGRAPENAQGPLASDATGTGGVQAGGQLALERTFGGSLFVHLSGSAVWRAPRVVSGLHTQRGPAFTAFAAAGTTFLRGDLVGAVTASYTAEIAARLEGVAVPDSGNEVTRAGLSGGYTISYDWRIQGSLFGDIPVAPLSRNQPVGVGLSLMLLRAGW